MPTTSSPIPDNLRPLVAIGSILPPFALVILAFLWVKLHSDPAVIGPVMGYCAVTLVPLLLSAYARYRYKDQVLPGSGWLAGVVFWTFAISPLFATMYSLPTIDLQFALALPTVLITGFAASATMYLVFALLLVRFKPKTA